MLFYLLDDSYVQQKNKVCIVVPDLLMRKTLFILDVVKVNTFKYKLHTVNVLSYMFR